MQSHDHIQRHKRLLLVVTLSMVLFSCGKRWKTPVDVSFNFEINQGAETDLIHFKDAELVLGAVRFDGTRKQGQSNIELDQEYESGKIIKISHGKGDEAVALDIPQGTYTDMELSIELDKEKAVPVMLLSGYYYADNHDSIELKFEFNEDEEFIIENSGEVVLLDVVPVEATIVFDPVYWFGLVTKELLDSADVTTGDLNNKTIYISEGQNTVVYQLVIDRLQQNNTVKF